MRREAWERLRWRERYLSLHEGALRERDDGQAQASGPMQRRRQRRDPARRRLAAAAATGRAPRGPAAPAMALAASRPRPARYRRGRPGGGRGALSQCGRPARLSRYAGQLSYALAPGASERWQPPVHGPFDARLGYTRLADFQRRLLQSDFRIEQQARFSPALMRYAERGFFPPYREKTSAGLDLATCSGEPLYRFRHPERHYPDFESIPPVALAMLLFIENRGLLDSESPHANPAVDWPRFAARPSPGWARHCTLPGQSAGGSTPWPPRSRSTATPPVASPTRPRKSSARCSRPACAELPQWPRDPQHASRYRSGLPQYGAACRRTRQR